MLDITGLHKLIDEWAAKQDVVTVEVGKDYVATIPVDNEPQEAEVVEATEERKLPEGKRVVRTKSSGDRVYLIDEVAKTRHWITNPEVLQGLGFEMTDVVDVEDNELLKYQMGAAKYRAD